MLAQRQIALAQKIAQRIAQLELVAQAQLDVDALYAVGVLGHARQRNYHVFVDLEGVGVAADGSGALAVQPEFLARLGADGDEAFTAARIGQTHDLAGGARHGVGVVTGDVTNQHHLGQGAALGLGGVAHRAQVAVVQMLQAGQQHAGALLLGEHEVLDFDDAGHGVARMAKELHAHGAGVAGHAVHNPAPGGDQAVAALFLDARQAAQELVRHVLAQAFLAEARARDVQALGAYQGLAVGLKVFQLEAGQFGVVDLAQVVVQARDLQPLRVRRHHAPRGQVVQCRAPQHGLFAAGVHRDVAADAAGFRRGRIHGKHKTAALGRIGHALRDHASFAPDGCHRMVNARQADHLDLGHGFELFGVDDRALPRQRHRAAGVASAAATRDDGQAEFDAGLDQSGHLGLGVRRQHHERVFDAPVGGVGDVRHARQAVELDVVPRGHAAQPALAYPAQLGHFYKSSVKGFDGARCGVQKLTDQGVAGGVHAGLAALLHGLEPVLQGFDQLAPALRVVQQIVLQVGVALHHPDIAQDFVQHARRAPGATLLAQLVGQLPGASAKQANDDFAVGKTGVVVRDFAQARRFLVRSQEVGERGGCVHRESAWAAASDRCPAEARCYRSAAF